MTPEGPTFVLAIDHRNSLRHWYKAITGAATADYGALRAAKVVVAEGLLAALGEAALGEVALGEAALGEAALLVDEEYGQDAIRAIRAADQGVSIIVPAERSGQPEFSFEHGDQFGAHITATGPDIVKALVRYNPAGDQARNARSRAGLAELARWLDDHGLPLMLELLVPPEPAQAGSDFDNTDFDNSERPVLTVAAITELREAGLSPAYWKVEGQPSTEAFASLAAASDGRCLVLGRGEDAAAVGRWVAMAAAAEGFSGFAVGRTIWADALGGWLTGRAGRDETVATIARNYLHFIRIYVKNRRA